MINVTTRDGQQIRGILVTYVSQKDTSSSREGLQIYEYRIPFWVFGLASPSVSKDGSTREPTHEDIKVVIQMIQCLFCLYSSMVEGDAFRSLPTFMILRLVYDQHMECVMYSLNHFGCIYNR